MTTSWDCVQEYNGGIDEKNKSEVLRRLRGSLYTYSAMLSCDTYQEYALHDWTDNNGPTSRINQHAVRSREQLP